jgi:hypothetical protein
MLPIVKTRFVQLKPLASVFSRRNVILKTKPPPLLWTKPAIEEKILNLLMDYAQVPEEKVI